MEEVPSQQQEEAQASMSHPLAGTNGLSLNGLILSGLVIDGLNSNGLATRGLAEAGLSSPAFITWFNQDPMMGDRVMQYVVYCSVKWGAMRTFTSPATGVTYTWNGWLGLAQNWSKGTPISVVEQQLVSACLAAHLNTYGMHVQLSLLGDDDAGRPLYVASGEYAEYNTREACFFGNLFNGEGLYAANDRNALLPVQSTPRRCGLSRMFSGADPECDVLTRLGSCEKLNCTLDRNANYYRTCSYNGITYRVLTTRLRPADVYTCGDGVCQVSEKCGTGETANSCGLDCGPCP